MSHKIVKTEPKFLVLTETVLEECAHEYHDECEAIKFSQELASTEEEPCYVYKRVGVVTVPRNTYKFVRDT